ncbi:hypothetical protein D3C81_1767980 [compost metagenome]
MSAQPAGIETAEVTVLPVDAQAAVGIDMGGGRLEVFSGIDNLEHLLAGNVVDALRARAVIPQPDVVKRADATVSPCDGNAIRQGLHATERADQRISTEIGNSGSGVHGGSL